MENSEQHEKIKKRNFLKKSFNKISDEISVLKITQNEIERELKILNFELMKYDLEQKEIKQENENK